MPSIKRVEEYARRKMASLPPSHGWDHVMRVVKIAKVIAEAEGADRDIVALAALLHDTGRKEEIDSKGRVCHAEVSSRYAERILKKEGFNQEVISRVKECILAHRYRRRKKPRTIEAKVVFDADKLDSIGATGVARAFLFAGEVGAKLHNSEINPCLKKDYSSDDTGWREYRVKLRFIKDMMQTRSGKRVALKRHRFMKSFFKVLDEEYRMKR